VIYFIRALTGGPIKIGTAANPWQRVATLQTGNPQKLCVVAVIHGGKPEESNLHSRFAACRTQGEWFNPAPDLCAYIDGIRAAQREAPPTPMPAYDLSVGHFSRDQLSTVVIGALLAFPELFQDHTLGAILDGLYQPLLMVVDRMEGDYMSIGHNVPRQWGNSIVSDLYASCYATKPIFLDIEDAKAALIASAEALSGTPDYHLLDRTPCAPHAVPTERDLFFERVKRDNGLV
jgi:hypothetical protein